MSIKIFLQKYLAHRFYPTNQKNWYLEKGYVGDDDQDIFLDFINKQQQPNGFYYKEFVDLSFERIKISSKNHHLDAVIANRKIEKPDPVGPKNYIVMFFGRSEYYESKFRDIAYLAKETNSTILAFNPSGLNSSTGDSILTLSDLVDDGISVISYLMANRNISPKQIIMFGNSLGAAVIYKITEYFSLQNIAGFREINSNSFSSLSQLIIENLNIFPPFKKIAYKLLHFVMCKLDWDIKNLNSFHEVNLHRFVLTREGDCTIKYRASFYASLDIEKDLKKIASEKRDEFSSLLKSSFLYTLDTSGDPHNLNLYSFVSKERDCSVFKIIHQYLKLTSD